MRDFTRSFIPECRESSVLWSARIGTEKCRAFKDDGSEQKVITSQKLYGKMDWTGIFLPFLNVHDGSVISGAGSGFYGTNRTPNK